MKAVMWSLAIAFCVGTAVPAVAHEAKPKHGGVVRTAADLQFELVTTGDTVTIYVEDHGKPLATAGASAKFTVLSGAERTEIPLQPAGENRLEAKGTAKLAPGAVAVATITFPPKKTVNVRFVVK